MPGRGGEAYHCRTPLTGNPYTTLANPSKLGFTHEISYAWVTSWFKLKSIIAWSGFVWIIRLEFIISIVTIFWDRDMASVSSVLRFFRIKLIVSIVRFYHNQIYFLDPKISHSQSDLSRSYHYNYIIRNSIFEKTSRSFHFNTTFWF